MAPRAHTGIRRVLNWGQLGQKDGDIFTRMRVRFIFHHDGNSIYEYYNRGILTYADEKNLEWLHVIVMQVDHSA